MKLKQLAAFIALLMILSFTSPVHSVAAKTKPSYTISPSSKTYKNLMMNFSTYNQYTKHYYLLRSYLERLEKTGGGTLTLKKGTYTISNTLYVPSNVTIKLQSGAKLVKGMKTGTRQFGPSSSIFQFVRPAYAYKKGVYGGYNGVKNVSIIGTGTATIDMKYYKDGIAIIAGHNQNIKIQNITFQNMYSGHFIEIDATKNATISGNTFKNSKASPNKNKEAINIDTPDKLTKGWSQQWSKFDRTPNSLLLISKNTFENLDRAIGTHKYSGDKYHDRVTIKDNTIRNTRQDAIRLMNWSNAVIENNLIKDVTRGPNNDYRGILASGAINPTIRNNTFQNTARPAQFFPWKNSGPGSEYSVTYNKLNKANIEAFETNIVRNNTENFIRINTVYGQFDHNTTQFVNLIAK
ncbi:right-handed parallel beta-helix repeat-containing protein [Aciduricibacillus chroicocephali]|uniref:Right-handed parallel beta-helix repeat-containing protein n=1 Tax=Aciduricibacillus chroicocephali TaxID=3054939 RepID=A0ABY9KSP4_9BACI|nr:right-handed parallel beta-helix repeat-containing protein [Bacillaceae bacterium 44XB]